MLKLLRGGYLKLETKFNKDIGEEILFKLKKIIAKFDKILNKNGKEQQDPSVVRDRT